MKVGDLIAGIPKADLDKILLKVKANPDAMASIRAMTSAEAIAAISRFSAEEIAQAFQTIKSMG
jgi:hypothetical protein